MDACHVVNIAHFGNIFYIINIHRTSTRVKGFFSQDQESQPRGTLSIWQYYPFHKGKVKIDCAKHAFFEYQTE